MAKSDKIAAQIEQLKAQLAEQTEKERAARKRRIARIAERSGATRIDIPADAIEAAFRQLVADHSDESEGDSAPDQPAGDTSDDAAGDESAGERSTLTLGGGYGA